MILTSCRHVRTGLGRPATVDDRRRRLSCMDPDDGQELQWDNLTCLPQAAW